MPIIRGILPALPTPFTAEGRVHAETLRALVSFLLEQGVHGFYVNGSTGEGLLLDPDERKQALEIVLSEVNGRVPVIAHVGAMATQVAADLAAHAASAGAAAVAAIPPIYFAVDTLALQAHYRQIAQAAGGTPVWVYNIPGATGVTITPAIMASLLEIEQVQGIKFSSYNFYEMRTIIELAADREFSALSGPDEMCLPALVMGASGAIGTTFNLMGRHFVELYNRYQMGDLERARTLQFAANRVIRALLTVPLLSALKLVLGDMGFDCGLTRSPLRPLTDAEKDRLYAALAESPLAEIAGQRR